MNRSKTPPYLGAAYYPEDWDDSEMEDDIRKMAEAGMTVARIGEFAWRKMEPSPGAYDFTWLHTVVDSLAASGILTILGTPTATPPIWLSHNHPDVMAVQENGRPKKHGGRRHCCSNNPHYRSACDAVVEALGREFGADPHVIGWQLDNEIYRDGCFCPCCQQAFTGYLTERYGSIEDLNAAWNLNLFSQAYDDFPEVPTPSDAWHNPHLQLLWKQFQADSHIDFIHRQCVLLKKYTRAPIGTDMMPFQGVDYERMNEPLDVVEFNHYNTRENLWTVQFWFDLLRPLKARPFWNTETAANWNGSAQVGQTLKPEGFCRANSWLPVALGGEANLYWLWRTHWAGHELMHGGVLNSCGRPSHVMGEVQQTAADFAKAADFLNSTHIHTEIALHCTSLNWNMFETQSVVEGLKYEETLLEYFYRPLLAAGLRPDVIGARHPLTDYKVLLSPLMLTLEDGDLPDRILRWVRDGGTWIVGPMTDVRDSVGAKYTKSSFGMLEEMTGARCLYQIPDSERAVRAAWKDGTPLTGSRWYDVFEADGDSLADVTAGHSALVGQSVLLRKQVGRGTVLLLGTLPSAADMARILAMSCRETGLCGYSVSGSVCIVPRCGQDRQGLILVECGGDPACVETGRPMTDLLTGRQYSGQIQLKPYDTLVLV